MTMTLADLEAVMRASSSISASHAIIGFHVSFCNVPDSDDAQLIVAFRRADGSQATCIAPTLDAAIDNALGQFRKAES
jgi:hypothetical protein